MVAALNHKKLLVVTNQLAVHRIEVAFTKREIIKGIQQIGFARTILSHQAIDSIPEGQFCLLQILIIEQAQMLYIHKRAVVVDNKNSKSNAGKDIIVKKPLVCF